MPQPFNLTDLCQRLLLDFYLDDLDAKENAAIGMMEGQDPIQGCRQILRENRCLLVIDGLQSKDDWDLINTALLSGSLLEVILLSLHVKKASPHIVQINIRIFSTSKV